MINALKEMFTGKKWTAAVSASIVAAALKIGLELPSDAVALIVSPIMAYIVGQGWADSGKEAAKIAK